jgi:hypothetical protein
MESRKGPGQMLYLQDLRRLASSFLEGRNSFDHFADSYRHISRGKFGASPDVLKACLDIDAALSMVYFDDATENEFREELAKAVHPFALEFSEIDIRFLPDSLLAPAPTSAPYNIYLDYRSQQYALFAQFHGPMAWISPYGTSTAVSEVALPLQVDSAASASRFLESEAVTA